jgi:hypothetical protein
MDKLKWTANREGIALLITLITIAMLMAGISVLFKILGDAQKGFMNTSALIQANLYYDDITKVFKDIPSDKREEVFTQLYLTPVVFSKEDGSFSLGVSCKPLTAGVNINWLAYENVTEMSSNYVIVRHLFEAIALQYNIADMGKLETMILEEIELTQSNVSAYQSRLFQKSQIISYQQFRNILTKYQLEMDDQAVWEVPWENLLSFVPDAGTIDANNMSAELISLLFDLDLHVVQSEWSQEAGGLKQIIEVHTPEIYKENQKVFEEKFTEYAACRVSYQYDQKRYSFTFNDLEGEVNHFEFYGRQ